MTIAAVEEDLPDFDVAGDFYAKYEPKQVLGKGVSSTVRRCVEKSTGKEYAVKIIDLTGEKDNEFQQEEIRQATVKEINVLRLCGQHPHIIELHEAFESTTFIFLVMELFCGISAACPASHPAVTMATFEAVTVGMATVNFVSHQCKKGELFDYLTEVVTLSEKRTRMVMRQLLEAVEFCHSQSIAHRDLKPENILLDDNFNIKLSDFGFATFVKGDEDLTDLCGTPGYLAPEVLKVSMYDNAPGYSKPVDMWAIGVIMYTLLVGCPPFWHRKQMYMLRAIMEGRYSFSSPEWNDVSEPPKDLITKLLKVEPAERLTAIEALAHPFFKREEASPMAMLPPFPGSFQREEKREFFPKRLFKAAAITILAMHRIRTLHLNPPPISFSDTRRDPYSIKLFRKAIDGGAFRIYGHWVKRGENQNRAALFENVPKKDLKSAER